MNGSGLQWLGCLALLWPAGLGAGELSPPPRDGKLVFEEDWSSGRLDPSRWYAMRRHWGGGNHGVVPENVSVREETVPDGSKRHVLVCLARGDRYHGPVTGMWGKPARVGGVVATHAFFGSGRFEVSMRVGTKTPLPKGMIPAIWIYAGQTFPVAPELADDYVPSQPLYQPYLQEWGRGIGFYTSELDFPELGKGGDYNHCLCNSFINKRSHIQTIPLAAPMDAEFHTWSVDWRTHLRELPGLRDDQVAEHLGYWWVRDLKVPFESYQGHPLKRLGPDRYAVHEGRIAVFALDGAIIGQSTTHVPSMPAQMTLGVWLPDWAGPADWETAEVAFGKVRIWQYGDPGDAPGILTKNQPDNFGPDGQPVR